MDNTQLIVSYENPFHPDSLLLIKQLSIEISERYNDPEEGSGAFLPEDVLIPRAAFVVARLNGKPAGCGAIKPFDSVHNGNIAEVKRMFVEPGARGLGISRAILKKLEEAALSFGYDTLKLETGTKQPEAIRLYETSGFYRIPCYGIYTDNPWSVCYEKKLTS